VAETANGCLVLHQARTIAERHNRELEHLKKLFTRSSVARQESFCPLDTDLSWMSSNATPLGAESERAVLCGEIRLFANEIRRF
jgi:hypothetical protein